MKDNNSLAHSTWNCKYHIVFAPKYRRMEIYGKIRKDIGVIIVITRAIKVIAFSLFFSVLFNFSILKIPFFHHLIFYKFYTIFSEFLQVLLDLVLYTILAFCKNYTTKYIDEMVFLNKLKFKIYTSLSMYHKIRLLSIPRFEIS